MQLPFFYEPEIQDGNNNFEVSEATARHCLQVLRMKKGDVIQLTDGKGSLYSVIIISDNKKHCIVSISNKELDDAKQPFICIAIAPVKNTARLEWFIEKATEIGINEIVMLQTKRTEKFNYKQERLQSIAVSAMLQSRQTWLPSMQSINDFTAFVKDSQAEQRFIAHCANDDNKVHLSSKDFTSATILIGPEGDFTLEEIELAKQYNYQPVSLGNTRLRTETAGIVAAALLRNHAS